MKKRRFVYALSAMLLLGTPLVGCNNNPDQPDPDKPLPTPTGGDVHYFDATLSSTSTTIGVGETLNIVISNVIDKDGKAISDAEFDYSSDNESVATVNTNGTITGISAGNAKITVECLDGDAELAVKTFDITVTGKLENANGAYNFVAMDYEEKLDILGKLEKYAVEQHLTGITLFQNGGYMMYNDRVVKPTNNYITGYGFGTKEFERLNCVRVFVGEMEYHGSIVELTCNL